MATLFLVIVSWRQTNVQLKIKVLWVELPFQTHRYKVPRGSWQMVVKEDRLREQLCWKYRVLWGGVEGWGEKAYNCNWITIKKEKKKKIQSCPVQVAQTQLCLTMVEFCYRKIRCLWKGLGQSLFFPYSKMLPLTKRTERYEGTSQLNIFQKKDSLGRNTVICFQLSFGGSFLKWFQSYTGLNAKAFRCLWRELWFFKNPGEHRVFIHFPESLRDLTTQSLEVARINFVHLA